MAVDAVGSEVLVDGDEMQAVPPTPSGARDARGGADDDVLREAGGDQRSQRQDGRGRIAAGVGDESRSAHLVAVELGQPIHGVVQELG
jgi:hypothetical protein